MAQKAFSNPYENLSPEETDVTQFRPRTGVTRPLDTPDRASEKAAVEELAKTSGFVIDNNAEQPIKAAKKSSNLKTFLKTMRIQIKDYNKFQRWCNVEGYSQQEGFNRLAKHIPEVDSKNS
jgi:hypothetical protein